MTEFRRFPGGGDGITKTHPIGTDLAQLAANGQLQDGLHITGKTVASKYGLGLPLQISEALGFIATPGRRLPTFDAATGWSNVTGGGTATVGESTDSIKLGNRVAKGLAIGATVGTENIECATNFKMQTDLLSFYFYCDVPSTVSGKVIFRLYTGGSTTNHYYVTAGTGAWGGAVRAGLTLITIKVSELAVGGGTPDWTQGITKIRWNLAGGGNTAGNFVVSDLWIARASKPKVCLTFDSGFASQWDRYIAEFRPRGLRGTFFVAGAEFTANAGNSGMTLAQLDQLYAEGNAVGTIGYSHNPLTGMSLAAAQAEIEQALAWNTARGYIKGRNTMAWPNGAYNDDLIALASAMGIELCRVANDAGQVPIGINRKIDGPLRLMMGALATSAITSAIAYAHVTNAKKYGSAVIFAAHKFHASTEDSITWTNAKLTAFLDLLVADVDAGLVDVVTLDELAAGVDY